jgi:DNA modification methylase
MNMPPIPYLSKVKRLLGDCRQVMPTLPAHVFDSVVTDPPYELGFMGKKWDATGVAFDPATWRAVLRVLKPGGYMLAMGGSRTYHRLACAIEDAGFEIRDCLMWLYGSGFPKGQGCLKPAYEPILLARRPGPKVLPLGVNKCRVGAEQRQNPQAGFVRRGRTDEEVFLGTDKNRPTEPPPTVNGRYPANVLHDGGEEVMEAFAAFGLTSTTGKRTERSRDAEVAGTAWGTNNHKSIEYADEPPGTAARFFYTAKASKRERGEGNNHPTVKPLALMRWLVKLVTPEGGTVLDPFGGSGSTACAALLEGRRCTLIEENTEYHQIIKTRLKEYGE